METDVNSYRKSFENELDSILNFWKDNMQDPSGGFYGRMDGHGRIVPDAPKGAILNARILWAFAAAYRVTGSPEWLALASRAKDYICAHFIDYEFGGAWWSVNADGTPLDTKKQFYSIAFIVYGMAEHYRACGDESALEVAKSLYFSIEDHSRDVENGGYIEASDRFWNPISDMRLSYKERNDAKTMNTHLHILEAYTALYRVWKDAGLHNDLRDLVLVFLDRIASPDGHLGLFFDMDWRVQGGRKSFGHEIEASWLLCEAADVLGDSDLADRTRRECMRIAEAAMEGYRPGSGLAYEYNPETGVLDEERHWWVQTEAVVGFRNMYSMTSDARWADAESDVWDYIRRSLICPDGEWYWSILSDGSPNLDEDRAGFWKCPYHNGRMCMEMLERI